MKTISKYLFKTFISFYLLLSSITLLATENEIQQENSIEETQNDVTSNNDTNITEIDPSETRDNSSNQTFEENEEVSTTWNIKPYAGGSIFSDFVFFKEESPKYFGLGIFYKGWLGSKFEYVFPESEEILKGDIKIRVKKDTIKNFFEVELRQACIELWMFKLGLSSSNFNTEKKGIPQFKFFNSFDLEDNQINLGLSIEASNSNNYYDTFKELNTKLYVFKDISIPVALVPQIKYSFKDLFEFELIGLTKLLVTSIETKSIIEEKERKKDAITDIQVLGGFNLITKIKPFNTTELKFGLMFGKGIGSHMSDWTSSFISNQEKLKSRVESDENDQVKKDGGIVTLWGLRTVFKISQQLSRSFKFYCQYMLDTAGEDIDKLLKPRKDEENFSDKDKQENGYEKWHKIQPALEWNVNGADIVKIMTGINVVPFEEKKSVFSIFLKLGFELAK